MANSFFGLPVLNAAFYIGLLKNTVRSSHRPNLSKSTRRLVTHIWQTKKYVSLSTVWF